MPNKRRAHTIGTTRKHRRDQRHRAGRHKVEVFYGPEAGPGIEQAPLEEVLAALTAHGEELDWPSSSSNVLPVIPRVRPYPGEMPKPVRTMVPPGILVGFGIDIGPAFMNINEPLLASWGLSVGDVTATALANLHRRAVSVERTLIHHGQIGEYSTEWLQTGVSVGSILVLAPSELRRLFGGPRFFITPMRDLIIGFPRDVDREAAHWLYHEIADLDPNCLGPTGYDFDGVRVTPASLETGGHTRAASVHGSSAFVA